MAYHHQVPGPSSGSGYQFGDTTFTKVFVGGLAWETQSETMRRYFEQFGDILEAVVISDKNTGRSKGYGFVTFREPDAARRACLDPSPIIDGRRANCNLASLGRPRLPVTFGRPRASAAFVGTPRGAYIAPFGYHHQQQQHHHQQQQQPQPSHQQQIPYNYQGLMYPPNYGYSPYGPEYVYQQGGYNPYAGQQYLQIYGVPGTVNAAVYPYGQALPSGGQAYTAMQGYAMPGHQIVQFGGATVSGLTTSPMPTVQSPYGMAGGPVMAQPQFMVPSQYVQGILDCSRTKSSGNCHMSGGLRI